MEEQGTVNRSGTMRRLGRRPHLIVSTAFVGLVVGLLPVLPAQAGQTMSRPTVRNHERLAKGKRLKVRPRKKDPVQKLPAAKDTWPAAGTAGVKLGASSTRSAAAPVKAGHLPIWIGRAPGNKQRTAAAAPTAVKVDVLGEKATRRLGTDGMVFTVARDDGAAAAGKVTVRLDYSSFAQAYGGSYGSRLRLVQLPGCSLTTPEREECRRATPLASRNNPEDRSLTVTVDAAVGGLVQRSSTARGATPSARRPAAGAPSPSKPAVTPRGKAISAALTAAAGETATVLAVTSTSAGNQGDYRATSLTASATWNAGGSTGDFSWSYPMRVPPVPGGLAPEVALSYSSSSVDGRTGNTNGQPSWVGEGFDLWPGFIERSYKSCEDDGAPKDEWGNSPGDLCWGYDNATLTWNGSGGELIPVGNGKWKLRNDDGTRIEKLTDAAVDNGDKDHEYWKVTTTDGTQYFFGHNTADGSPATQSTWTVPVFGDDAGEPCHDSAGFAQSWCPQAWRWNLDYVVDRNGNAIVYTYAAETNRYGRNLKATADTPYERGGYLRQISYGLRVGALSANPPAKVVFGTDERCIPDATFDCDPTKIGQKPDYWWDVPWDMNCNSNQECKDTHGTLMPTFWSRMRLTSVATQVINADGSTYRPVDTWKMDHRWGLADVDRDLLLREIVHTGKAGAADLTLPKVTFNHVQLPNRMDRTGDDILPYIRYRVGAIYDESGGQIDVAYSDPDCTLSNLPKPETNTTRCMPVKWQPPGREAPITDWFIKYVVTSVIQTDRTGLGEDMATRYDYLGGAAWHYDDDDGLTKEKYKTWSQWRGYGHVRTRTGDFNNPSTRTEAYYLRGMDGDRLNGSGGEKDEWVFDLEGTSWEDHEALAGFQFGTETYSGPAGDIVSKTVSHPWRHRTALKSRPWGAVTANLTGIAATKSWEAMPGGNWRETRVNTGYDTETGRKNWVDDLGDISTAADNKCTRTSYNDDDAKWFKAFPSRVDVVSVSCADTSPDRKNRTISDVKTSYDAKRNPVLTERLVSHNGTTGTYKQVTATTQTDGYGRPTQISDFAGNVATTTFVETPATGGLTTKVTVTGPPVNPAVASSAHQTVRELDPAWGLPVKQTDAAGKLTELSYDSLGRSTKVWLPDRSKANNQVPNLEFTYMMAEEQIVAVTTKTLTATGGQRSSIQLLDGWLRERQTQAPGPEGRIIADTFYDNRGQVTKTYAAYSAKGAPEAALFGVLTPGNIETQARYSYDGLGRVTTERVMAGNSDTQELWRTTTSYDGNRTYVQPPAGGTPTTTITDARGNTTEVIQHGPNGAQTSVSFDYDHAGRQSRVTGSSGKQWSTTYDFLGRKIETVDPDTGTTTFAYDDLDRLISTDDARATGDKLFYKYDVLGRKTETRSESTNGTVLATWVYDTVRKGALTSATRKGTGPDGNTYDYTTKVNSYDVLGRVKSTTISIPSVEGVGTSYTFGTNYNLDGTVQSQGLPAAGGLAGEALVSSYDDYLRPTRLTSNLGTYVNATDYTPTGKPLQYELGNVTGKRGWITNTWQYATGRLAVSQVNREGVTGAERKAAYAYDDAGNITAVTDTSRGGTETQCFAYDYLRQLTDAWTVDSTTCPAAPSTSGGPAPYRMHYTYNADGTRNKEEFFDTAGTPISTRMYRYQPDGGVSDTVKGHMLGAVDQNGANPFTGPDTNDETFVYDAVGNTTSRKVGTRSQAFTFDTESELTKITDTGAGDGTGKGDTTFVYTADGDRLIRRDPTGTTLYLPGTEVKLAKGSTTAAGTRYYGHGGQTIAMRTNAGVTYLAGDHQDTGQVTIDAADPANTARRRYTPFGQPRGTTGTWPAAMDRGFVGGTNDVTGLTHLGAREYDPGTGRFLSVDPVFDETDPLSWNGYTYAHNSPVTMADPDGRRTVKCNGKWVDERKCNPGKDGKMRPDPGAKVYDDYVPPGGNGTGQGPSSSTSNQRQETQRTVIIYRLQTAKTPQQLAEFNRLKQGFCSQYPQDSLCTGNYGGPGSHGLLQSCGMAPGVGAACDIGDTALYASEGNFGEAAFGALAAVPLLGDIARFGKWGKRLWEFGDKAGEICNLSSFVPGTKVKMADGTTKPIEELQVGDKVLATDPTTGTTKAKTVLATITSQGHKNLVDITVHTDPSQRHGEAGLLIATDAHPFWVGGDIKRWIKAKDLQPGMSLRTPAGTYVKVTALHHRSVLFQRVHNLTIADLHTYYVEASDTSVLVHNADGCRVTKGGRRVIGKLMDLKDTPLREAIRSRGGGAGQVNQVASHLQDLPVGEVANRAAAGDAEAVTAIKMLKQASSKAQKYGGKS